jgi:GT2 family glycosyltransferase/glycosyltransferase involved in cell wall biosynthesis
MGRTLRAILLLLLAPFLVAGVAVAVALLDVVWLAAGRRRPPVNSLPRTGAASVVIPNWNGRDLLEKYLPSVVTAIERHPGSELIVVDNGSTDGSRELLRERFPEVRVLALPENRGFGGGSNAGFAAARNDIVVLLNSDMRVAPDFLQPLLDGFMDETVFAVSCQIFFTDPNKTREETGLTQAWWENGWLRVRHRLDEKVDRLFPCFYGGGGSCAFDRRKFLELGGFDELLKPFYLEDTDLGFLAWKRGWKVFYQPASQVWHEHRGTIGKKFSREYIENTVRKNFLLFTWKNIHEPGRIAAHACYALAGAILSLPFGESLERPNLVAVARAFWQLPRALHSRWRARCLATIDDTEAFRRPMGGYFHDRFATLPAEPERCNVLFVSPYPICPPVHGGGVFMYQTCRELARLVNLHLIVLVDEPVEIAPHEELARQCGSAEFLVRLEGQTHSFGAVHPHAVIEYKNGELEWLIHRQIFLQSIDIVQLEYLPMAQYRSEFRRVGQVLFEHDVYFQSIGRQLPHMRGTVRRTAAGYEYLRSIRYELSQLPRFDRVQVCSESNREYLLSFSPELEGLLDDDLRAGVIASDYPFRFDGRQPLTMLFLGSFRHLPNQEALYWFVNQVMPHVLARCPLAKLIVIGSDPPPRYSLPDFGEAIDLRGYADDILTPLSECALFVCPILAGSGIRVKLLEAFACGIPVVSTTIGAEGLASTDGDLCALADDPEAFAGKVLHLLGHPEEARAMAERARRLVEQHWDMKMLTRRLEESYRRVVAGKRAKLAC